MRLSLIILTFFTIYQNLVHVHSQRSLLHWQRDLEYRLQSYENTRQNLDNLIQSSVISQISQQNIPNGARVVSSGGSVRFSDLIIPNGALILESHVARPTLRLMVNKTDYYVNTKFSELRQIQYGLNTIRRQVNDPSRRFVYKGSPNNQFTPQVNFSRIPGTWIMKQFMYARLVESQQVELTLINNTNVNNVMRDVYMENPRMGARDPQSRLFFEGRKTFWRSVFERPLTSGCCDRLRPLHTSQMMTRSTRQTVEAPVLFHTNDIYNKQPVLIRNLLTPQLNNRILAVGLMSNRPDDSGLITSSEENIIRLNDLINTKQSNPTEIIKTIVFKEFLVIDEAQVWANNISNRGFGIGFMSHPSIYLDLSYDNFLFKYSDGKNRRVQKVLKSVIIDGEAQFEKGVDASVVNRVPNFGQFVQERIVRTDRKSIIRGAVQFDALPLVLNRFGNYSRSIQSVQIMQVERDLIVNSVNGMRIPFDIVLFPLVPNAPIIIRGPRVFESPVLMRESVRVQRLINNIQMPDGVIPLHLNDFMGSVRGSHLWFVDGITTQHVTVQSGRFDEIPLKDVHDPQSLIMQSVFVTQPDGSKIIRAPLQIKNLTLINNGPDSGLLNGFRPQDLLEFSPVAQQPRETTLFSRKTFSAPIEVGECLFSEMNQLSNWTNHLIRIDIPNTVQTVHTKLMFINPPYLSAQMFPNHLSSVQIDRLSIEFYPNHNPQLYFNNLNISPEFYVLQQALIRTLANHTEGRYRVLDQVRMLNPYNTINGVSLYDIVTLDEPFKFADRYVMVGKVELRGNLRANRITSNYPINVLDLEQFNKYRIPIVGSQAPIRLNHLVLSSNNQASYLQCRMLNGISFNVFANSIMSLTKPQIVESSLVFTNQVNLEGFVKTGSSVNSIKNFKQFAEKLKNAKYSFDDGLQCNSIVIRV